ncbi:MAG TPA: flagellar basal-body MS-ring/collar protein FliF [Candidatus Acidoferrum sp.]|jgi:flagellar M-ring protein FliF|nr:flagellar basal-body MS-ring/collar protein FliF [Candidatus Acidoferrum sp.]
MDKVLEQIRAFLRALTINQRILLAGSAALVAAIIWLFVRLFAAADFKNLYTGLDPSDTQKIVARLTIENIPYQLSSDGTSIDVPADKIDRVRIEMASQNLPHTGRIGFELFDKPNWSSSDFSERVNYQRALEAELERTIETMDTVESARVHLVLPRESLFTSEERPAKAAVVVKLRSQRLADETVASIANLVASAWENLSPDDVTIVSADGRLPLTAGKSNGVSLRRGLSDLETTIAERIVDTLAPVVGAEHVKSSVTIDYNPDSGETTQEVYDPNASALLTSQLSEDQTTGAAPLGIPGTTSNVPSAPPAPAAAGATPNAPQQNSSAAAAAGVELKPSTVTQGMRSESKTFAVSKTVHHTLEPPGQIKHLAAAVLVDDFVEVKTVSGKPQETRRKRTPEEMKQLEDLVRAAIGFSAQRGDELSLQNVSFQTPPVEVLPTPTAIQRTLRIIAPWMGLLRYAGLGILFLVIYALVLRPVTKQVLATLRALPEKSQQAALAATAGTQTPGKMVTGAELEGELQKELSETNSEIMRTVVLKRHLVEKVKKEPENATRLIQGWVRQA